MILLIDGTPYRKSTSALEILRTSDGPWVLMYAFIVLPVRVRDWVYDFIGNHRYCWFGRTEQCWIPEEDISDRFVDT